MGQLLPHNRFRSNDLSMADVSTIMTADTPSNDDGDERSLTDLNGVGESTARTLREAGYESIEDLREADRSDLADLDWINQRLASSIIGQVSEE